MDKSESPSDGFVFEYTERNIAEVQIHCLSLNYSIRQCILSPETGDYLFAIGQRMFSAVAAKCGYFHVSE